MRYAEMEDLYTGRLKLRRIVAEDIPAYFRLFGSAAVARYMLWEPHREIGQSEAAVRKVLSGYESGNCYRWGITRKEDDDLIGIVELLRFDESAETCSFAYMLSDAVWGRGYGTEVLRAVFSFAFDKMEVWAIIADHFAENPASGAVMRKTGMTYTGRLPGKYEKQGILQDAEEYCITREQWNKKTRY